MQTTAGFQLRCGYLKKKTHTHTNGRIPLKHGTQKGEKQFELYQVEDNTKKKKGTGCRHGKW